MVTLESKSEKVEHLLTGKIQMGFAFKKAHIYNKVFSLHAVCYKADKAKHLLNVKL